jgi:predicted nucleic acid-binding protein
MIFINTSAWLALADRHDRDHARVLEISRRIARGEFGKQVITNYVVSETLTLIRRRPGLPAAVSLAKTFATSAEVRLFWIEPVHHEEAVQLMAAHADKVWSVSDCTSFVVMRALGISNALARDDDFAQAGFSVLP